VAPQSFTSELHIAVASNFRAPLEQLVAGYEGAKEILISSGSSGTLYAQILNGAPYDIFLSANTEFPLRLEQEMLALPDSRQSYAKGILVIVFRDELLPQARLGHCELLQQENLSIAIANPRHAPYGIAAQQVLDHCDIHDGLIVRGNNINQAFQLWHSGGADIALVAQSQAGDPMLDIPLHWYGDLTQQAVILQRSEMQPQAREFMNWLLSEKIQSEVARLGYQPGSHKP